MKPMFGVGVAVFVLGSLLSPAAMAQSPGLGVAGSGTLVIKPLAEKKVAELPAGLRTDPPVSVPSASGTSPAARAAPEPEDEPPGW